MDRWMIDYAVRELLTARAKSTHGGELSYIELAARLEVHVCSLLKQLVDEETCARVERALADPVLLAREEQARERRL